MKNQNQSGGWAWLIEIALVGAICLSAGCSSGQEVISQEPSTDMEENSISQNVPPTAGMIAGTTVVTGQVYPQEIRGTKSPGCLKLDSLLNQVVASPDPLGTAASLNLRMDEGGIQVNILMTGDDPSFLRDFGVEPGSQTAQEIQVYVPIDQLCDIANLDKVVAIRVPAEAILP